MNTQAPSTRSIANRAVNSRAAANPDPYKWRSVAITGIFMLTLPALIAVMVLQEPEPPLPAWSVEAAALGVDRLDIARGQYVYQTSCAVCHGQTGDGVHSLGKPLRNSGFVQEQSNEQLFALIVDGRKPGDPANTTGALMPARGAQRLADDAVHSVVVYLRTMQDPGMPPVSTEPWNLVGRDSGAGPVGAIELTDHAGYDLYVASCAACHGQGAEGIEGLGLPLTTSGFIRGTDDAALVRFIKSGRSSWDENNSTGMDMPPKGGNPAITDEQLQTIVEYLRALQAQAMGE